MRDLYLKFADHAEALAALETAGVVVPTDENEEVRITYHDTGLPPGMLIVKAVGALSDGIVYAATDETTTDASGGEFPVVAAVEGFHVNLRLADGAALPEPLAAFLVAPQPATPSEIFW